jgi:hypothetical protein
MINQQTYLEAIAGAPLTDSDLLEIALIVAERDKKIADINALFES